MASYFLGLRISGKALELEIALVTEYRVFLLRHFARPLVFSYRLERIWCALVCALIRLHHSVALKFALLCKIVRKINFTLLCSITFCTLLHVHSIRLCTPLHSTVFYWTMHFSKLMCSTIFCTLHSVLYCTLHSIALFTLLHSALYYTLHSIALFTLLYSPLYCTLQVYCTLHSVAFFTLLHSALYCILHSIALCTLLHSSLYCTLHSIALCTLLYSALYCVLHSIALQYEPVPAPLQSKDVKVAKAYTVSWHVLPSFSWSYSPESWMTGY